MHIGQKAKGKRHTTSNRDVRGGNNQGNTIDPFNTSRANQSILIFINGILINAHVIFIWIGIPKPPSQRFRLAANAFCFV